MADDQDRKPDGAPARQPAQVIPFPRKPATPPRDDDDRPPPSAA